MIKCSKKIKEKSFGFIVIKPNYTNFFFFLEKKELIDYFFAGKGEDNFKVGVGRRPFQF